MSRSGKKASNFANMDFVPTISDSEEDVPDLDVSDEEVDGGKGNSNKTEVTKKTKNSKKPKQSEIEDDSAKDWNTEFQFVTDGDDTTTGFDGWDFLGDGSSKKGDADMKTDVDLDSIIKRKGGLVNMVNVGYSDEEDEEEESEEDAKESAEDEELAMDGFGMGATAVPDGVNSEEEEEEEEEEVEDGETEELKSMGGKDVSDDEAKEDKPEEIAKFYAPEEESAEAKKLVHTSFNSLNLSRPVLKGLAELGYTKPSPIQNATIPLGLLGKDIIAGAVTGSGKTAAFMIPIIERLLYKPAKIASTRVIVLTPTRELAIQIADVGKKIAKFVPSVTFGLAVGGLNLRQQEQLLKLRPDIVIATPGRFIDHIRNSASFNVDSVEVLVIDEADRMLEEGFQDELNEIMTLLPSKRQTLLFSATMNSKIKQLVSLSLKRPVRVMIDPPKQASAKLTQEFVRIRKRDHLKPALLYHLIRKLDSNSTRRVVVFVSRKEMAHNLRIILGLLGMKVAELHGSLSQEQRLTSVTQFKSLEVPVLICTDLASRGLDIPKIEVVINYDMPKSHEIYLHRVGRTARAGREGRSITFVGESTQDRSIVKNVIKSVDESEGRNKALGRNVDWVQVEEINKLVESFKDSIDDVLEEEKQEEEILRAEMELRKGENLIKHKKEIQARPKRTWFQSEADKKNAKVKEAMGKTKIEVNSKKRKRQEAMEDSNSKRSYSKTQKDRIQDQERTIKRQTVSSGKKNKKTKKSKK